MKSVLERNPLRIDCNVNRKEDRPFQIRLVSDLQISDSSQKRSENRFGKEETEKWSPDKLDQNGSD